MFVCFFLLSQFDFAVIPVGFSHRSMWKVVVNSSLCPFNLLIANQKTLKEANEACNFSFFNLLSRPLDWPPVVTTVFLAFFSSSLFGFYWSDFLTCTCSPESRKGLRWVLELSPFRFAFLGLFVDFFWLQAS